MAELLQGLNHEQRVRRTCFYTLSTRSRGFKWPQTLGMRHCFSFVHESQHFSCTNQNAHFSSPFSKLELTLLAEK